MSSTPVAIQHVDYAYKAKERQKELEELRSRSLTTDQASRLQNAQIPTEVVNFIENQREFFIKEKDRHKEAKAYLNQYRANGQVIMDDIEKNRDTRLRDRDYSKQAKAYMNNYRANDQAVLQEREERRLANDIQRQSVQNAKEFLRTYKADDPSVLSEFKNLLLSSPSPDRGSMRRYSDVRASFYATNHHPTDGEVVRAKEVLSWPSVVPVGQKTSDPSPRKIKTHLDTGAAVCGVDQPESEERTWSPPDVVHINPSEHFITRNQEDAGIASSPIHSGMVASEPDENYFSGSAEETGILSSPVCLHQVGLALESVRQELALLERKASEVQMPANLSWKLRLLVEKNETDDIGPDQDCDDKILTAVETDSTYLTDIVELPTQDSMLDERTEESASGSLKNSSLLD